jgi:putative transposase
MIDFCCKHCGSTNLVRYGQAGGIQYWWCKDCHHKFADNEALPDMKTPLTEIGEALSMYYRGMSIEDISQHLGQQYNHFPSSSTVYEWICRFTDEAARKTSGHKPNVGYVWVADETILNIGGKKVWFWDIIDYKTRFLLASHMSFQRTTQHAQRLMEKAAQRAGKVPKVVLTDRLYAYLDGIELAFGGDTKHVQSRGFSLKPNTNLIERFHGTLKSRTKVMRGLKTPETALAILDGWLVHYNFFRPHEALAERYGKRTPAEKAGLNFPLKNWLDVVKDSKGSTQYVRIYPRERVQIGIPTRYNIRRGRKRRKRIVTPRKSKPLLKGVRDRKIMPRLAQIRYKR